MAVRSVAAIVLWLLALHDIAHGAPREPAEAARREVPVFLALSRAGFADGIVVDAAHRSARWHHALPRHLRIARGHLVLKVGGHQSGVGGASMRVSIDGIPRTIVRLPDGGGEAGQPWPSI